MLYSINEMFYSIQGEGYHAGRPAVFIRFAGCNLNCPWCDTDHTKKTELTVDEIVGNVKILIPIFSAEGFLVVLTGGEPLLQNLKPLCLALKKLGCYIAVESNGTISQVSILREQYLLDWVTISPKPQQAPTEAALAVCSEIKIVLDGDAKPKEYEDGSRYTYCPKLYIQPCSEDYLPAVAFVLNNPKWRLSVQTQKIIGIK